ncbi:MAG: polysaccharide deacetylase family protein [Clostridiales bacterium]|nr:polysaccharide deacetylase family protein [Clostridiales bacterium]
MKKQVCKMVLTAALLLAAGTFPAQAETTLVQNASPVVTVRSGAETESVVAVEQPGGSTEISVAGSVQGEEETTGAVDTDSGTETSEPAGTAETESAASPVLTVGGGQTLQPDADSQTEESALQEETAVQEEQEEAVGRVIDPSRPMVALTFDDGPQTAVGNRIMDILAQYDGKATFFLVGSRVPGQAAEVARMVAEGHEVANHTMNHKYLQKLGAAQIQSEVNQCNDTIQAVCGVRPTLMRLPGGNHNATVLANTGMPMIQWSIDTLDWKTRNADATVAAVLNHIQDGDIVLMHELYSATGDAVARIVPELAARGYQMVTVSELAAAKGAALAPGQLYFSVR